MTAMQHSMDANTAAVKEVERKVEKLDSAMQEKEEDLEKIVKKTEFNIYDEMRERETRRLRETRGVMSRGVLSRGASSRGAGLNRGRGTNRGKASNAVRGTSVNLMALGSRATAVTVTDQLDPEQMKTEREETEEEETETETEEDDRMRDRRKRKERNEDSRTVGPPVKR